MADTQAGQAATRGTKRLQFAKARRIQLSLVFFTLPIIAALLKVFAFGLVLTVVSLLFLIPFFIILMVLDMHLLINQMHLFY